MVPCGTDPDSARAAGCVLDIVSFSWLPPRCHDAELAQEFRLLQGWEYFLDINGTQPVAQELALEGGFRGLYTRNEYHLRHCMFMWKKMHRAIMQGAGGKMSIDSVTAGYAHTEHCAERLVARREQPLDVVSGFIMVKYPDCGMA